MDFSSPPDCPYYLVYRVSLSITSAMKKGLAEAGIGQVKPAYLGVLISLWEEDLLRPNELGKRAGLEPSTMTGLLDRMERDGLVERSPDPEDRRAIRIQLTQDGIAAKTPAFDTVSRIMETVFSGIPETDIETANAVLRQVLLNCVQGGE